MSQIVFPYTQHMLYLENQQLFLNLILVIRIGKSLLWLSCRCLQCEKQQISQFSSGPFWLAFWNFNCFDVAELKAWSVFFWEVHKCFCYLKLVCFPIIMTQHILTHLALWASPAIPWKNKKRFSQFGPFFVVYFEDRVQI